MSRLKRVGLSLLSALLADLIVSLALSAPNLKRDGLVWIFWSWVMMLLLVIPGWILSLPIVLSTSTLAQWRIWMIAGVGSCIGPFVVLAISCYGYFSSQGLSTTSMDGSFMAIATGISILSTIIYIWLLKWREKHTLSSDIKST
jgi:hypothetical protein